MRDQCANWCNIRGAGIGNEPTSSTLLPDLIDAYFWLKTPGESDGCTETTPDGRRCPRYDGMCGSADSVGSRQGEPRAPEAGEWFVPHVAELICRAHLQSARGERAEADEDERCAGTVSDAVRVRSHGWGRPCGTHHRSTPSEAASVPPKDVRYWFGAISRSYCTLKSRNGETVESAENGHRSLNEEHGHK